MKLKWYGHSCFAMTFENGTVLITDPFDGSMQYPLCTARADIASATIILITITSLPFPEIPR